jgi:hypothetical protein
MRPTRHCVEWHGELYTAEPLKTLTRVSRHDALNSRKLDPATLGAWAQPIVNAGPAAARLLPVHDHRHRLWAVGRSRRPNLDPARIVPAGQTCPVYPDLHGGWRRAGKRGSPDPGRALGGPPVEGPTTSVADGQSSTRAARTIAPDAGIAEVTMVYPHNGLLQADGGCRRQTQRCRPGTGGCV